MRSRGSLDRDETTKTRGRRCNLPRDQLVTDRKLKKQHMERLRRACISERMTTLHNLAVSFVGADPGIYSHLERTDVLNNCIQILEGLSAVVKGRPDIQNRMRLVGCHLQDPNTSPLCPNSKELFEKENIEPKCCAFTTVKNSPLSYNKLNFISSMPTVEPSPLAPKAHLTSVLGSDDGHSTTSASSIGKFSPMPFNSTEEPVDLSYRGMWKPYEN